MDRIRPPSCVATDGCHPCLGAPGQKSGEEQQEENESRQEGCQESEVSTSSQRLLKMGSWEYDGAMARLVCCLSHDGHLLGRIHKDWNGALAFGRKMTSS